MSRGWRQKEGQSAVHAQPCLRPERGQLSPREGTQRGPWDLTEEGRQGSPGEPVGPRRGLEGGRGLGMGFIITQSRGQRKQLGLGN